MWAILGFLMSMGQAITNSVQSYVGAQARKELALKTEIEEERLQKKQEGIEDTEFGWWKSDVIAQGERSKRQFGDVQAMKGTSFSSMGEEQINDLVTKISNTINRAEESKARRRELSQDVLSTQSALNLKAVENADTSAFDITRSLFGIGKSGAELGAGLEKYNTLNEINQGITRGTQYTGYMPLEGGLPYKLNYQPTVEEVNIPYKLIR